MNLPAIPPRFQPRLAPTDTDPIVVAVAEQRARQWLEQERTQYFADPSAPLVPPANASGAAIQKADRDPVVQVVEDAGYEDFGFVVVRLDYSNQDAWARWSETFDGPADRSLAESVGGERIMDKLLFSLVEDAQLEGTGWHGAVRCVTPVYLLYAVSWTTCHINLDSSSYYKDLRLNSMVQPGLDTNIILVADKAAVDSFLFPTPGEEPWVWAVDVDYNFQIGDQPPQGESPSDRYPGYFRVMTSAAVTELWPLLKGSRISGKELWNPDVRVWEGV